MKLQFIEPKKDQIEYIIGIDFGHGETSAAICRVDNNKDPEDIDLTGTGRNAIPSTIYIESKDGGETILIGKEAVAEYGRGGSGDFYAYFKQSPDTLDESKNSNIRIMKLFMRKVYETICTRRAGELMAGGKIKKNHVVFIACPSQSRKWGDKAMQNYVTLALEAGLPVAGASIDDKFKLSGIVRESRAAYIRALQKDEAKQIATKGILVIDYGSSTIDITYYKEGEKPIDRGYQLGASFVEKAIFNYLKEAHYDLDGDQNPEILKQIERTIPSLATKLLYSIRESKEDFYTDYAFANAIEIGFKFKPRVNADKIDVELSKATITDEILPSYIRDVKAAFEDFKKNVIKSNIVTLLVLTGGASRMNFVQDLAKSVFGENVIMLPPQDPSLTVSNGIATAGRADVKLFFLLNDLLSDIQNNIYIYPSTSKLSPTDIAATATLIAATATLPLSNQVLFLNKKTDSSLYNDIKKDLFSKIAENLIKVLVQEISLFRDGFCDEYSHTKGKTTFDNLVESLKLKFNKNLDSDKIKKYLIFSYNKHIQLTIDDIVLNELKSYIRTYFPYYNIDTISNYTIPKTIDIQSLDSANMKTLSNIITTSFFSIVEHDIITWIQWLLDIGENFYTRNLDRKYRDGLYQNIIEKIDNFRMQIIKDCEDNIKLPQEDITIYSQKDILNYIFNEIEKIQRLIK